MKWDVCAGLDWAGIEASFESALIEDYQDYHCPFP